MKTFTTLTLSILALLFYHCGSKTDKPDSTTQIDSIKFVEPQETDLDTSIVLVEDSSRALILGKGPVRKLWERAYTWCGFKSQITGSRPIYLGPASTFRMGSIIDDKGVSYNTLDDLLTPDQKKKLYNYGSATPCDFEDDSKKKIETVLKANLDFGNAQLNALVQSERKVLFKIDSFKINSIKLDRLYPMLSKTENESLKEYLGSVTKPNRLLLSHEIEVKGFSAIINLEYNIEAGLQAKIAQGVIAQLADGNAQASVEIINSRTIKISSKNSVFFPFAACIKAELVTAN